MKKVFILVMFIIPFSLLAVLGPNVSQANGEELKWEEGAWDYFVMFKSLITQVTGSATTSPSNPQADTCIDPNIGSTFTLTSTHVPQDTNIDKAFLIWIAGQNPANFSGPTDNSVTLTFTNTSDSSVSVSQEITSPVSGTLFSPPDFNFAAVSDNTDSTGVFTYRVEVTDFMQEIINQGAIAGISQSGEALYGDYNVKGMDCNNDQKYLTTSGLVGGWWLVFVYTSEHISPKKIYIYDGMDAYRFQEATIDVSGFELPNEAEVRLTMLVAEGDPGLASATTDSFQPAPPEALAISGQSNSNFELLWNDCNPPKYSPLNYTEVFNSISSSFGWQDDFPTCIGGDPNNVDPNKIEYALDADTFLLKAKDFPFDSHLMKGDTSFTLKIGANQDQVYTNLLVLSVDTKAPKFDIPPNSETPDGREKSYCSCSTVADAVCFDRPFYYLIKIQNWGENLAENVTLQDTLPPTVDYVEGTTEIATEFENGLGTNWKPVSDIDGGFPFATKQEVMELMGYCNKTTMTCDDTVMVRFVVKPRGDLQKHEKIINSAVISDVTTIPYYSNSNIPLRLVDGACPAISECELPPKEQCGGMPGCASDEDCGDSYECQDGTCVEKDVSEDLTSNAQITFAEGDNSPDSDETIIITSPNNNLLLGQFYLLAEGNEGKYFNFNSISLKVTADDDVILKNFRLVYDSNANGILDDGERTVSTADGLSNGSYISFNLSADKLTPSGIKAHFIVLVDTETTQTSGRAGSFTTLIENAESINVSDAGDAKITGSELEFATYKFEPPEGFVFTRGANDPQVPSYSMMNDEHPMLQIRTKSMQGEDAIESIGVKVTTGTVRFGSGIKSIALLIDNDNDGKISQMDTVIEKITQFDIETLVTFRNLANHLTYSEGQEKNLLIVCDLKMKEGEKAQIQVGNGKVKLNTDKEIAELPVTSKEYKYEYDPTDPNNPPKSDNGGCSLTLFD